MHSSSLCSVVGKGGVWLMPRVGDLGPCATNNTPQHLRSSRWLDFSYRLVTRP